MHIATPAHDRRLVFPLPAWLAAVSAFLVLGGLWALAGMPVHDPDDRSTSLRGATGSWYHVYFTRPHAQEQPSDRVAGLDSVIITDLQHAQRQIIVACFDLDLRSVTDALKAAQQRGVEIRLVIDDQNLEKPLTAWMIGELQRANMPITFDHRRAFMHNKFLVIDEQIVWTGSANLTVNDIFRNNNNMLRIVSRDLAANYLAKFAALFAGQGGPGHAVALPHPHLLFGKAMVTNAFAPDAPITDEVVAKIKAARQSIDLLAFTFTSQPIAQAIIDAQRRKVLVRGVLERYNAHAAVSTLDQLKHAKVDIQLDGNCYNMHDKVMVIDGTVVITGSFNWTAAAQRQNDENVLMIEDRGLAQDYTREFERIYAQSRHPDRCS